MGYLTPEPEAPLEARPFLACEPDATARAGALLALPGHCRIYFTTSWYKTGMKSVLLVLLVVLVIIVAVVLVFLVAA
jgi:hypothetical protein